MRRYFAMPEPRGLALMSLAALGCSAGAASAPLAVASASARPMSAPQSASPASSPAQLAARLQLSPPPASRHNLIKNSTFDTAASLPWMASFTKPGAGEAGLLGGAYCVRVTDPGPHAWSAQFRHREMVIREGHRYSIRFKIASTAPTAAVAQIGMSGPPYKPYWRSVFDVGTEPQSVEATMTMTAIDDPTAEFAFQIGGEKAARGAPFSVCVDDVVLEDPEFSPQPSVAAPPVPAVLVNQVGYLPGFAKIAIAKSESTSPLPWTLIDGAGHAVAQGTTTVHGPDAASGDRVHSIDFSTVKTPGKGYSLRLGDGQSHRFAIDASAYRKLKYDALSYFYQTRSGLGLVMPYVREPRWARAAGHPDDRSVPCAPDAGCDYALDVSGGWYDAGDYGKYVVNGAVSVWTLLNQYERAKYLGTSASDFGDGKLNIPEGHNGVNDLLDEVRWELEFLMKMQVPDERPLAGMAHHKIHDSLWTSLGTRPDETPVPRFLRPVSTAATLDLAAVGAQCARVWQKVDHPFAERCLHAAERAWAAAAAHPALLITASDTVGGGAYEDADVSDERYWAAAELYATTKKQAYRDALMQSPHALSVPVTVDPDVMSAFTWQHVAALGTISLAVVPGALPREELAVARNNLVHVADAVADVDHTEGYRVGYRSVYHWGSNSYVLDNAIVVGLAYDFTKNPKYIELAQDGLSYLLGRNPMDQSYVTGYGFRPLRNPHHRFWAHQANPAFPEAPPGILAGGPNQDLQDPYGRAAGLAGCAPMKCYVDHIEAYSDNEEAINWNASLAWVAAFLDEERDKTSY